MVEMSGHFESAAAFSRQEQWRKTTACAGIVARSFWRASLTTNDSRALGHGPSTTADAAATLLRRIFKDVITTADEGLIQFEVSNG